MIDSGCDIFFSKFKLNLIVPIQVKMDQFNRILYSLELCLEWSELITQIEVRFRPLIDHFKYCANYSPMADIFIRKSYGFHGK